MPTYAFTPGQNVTYNGEVHTVFRKRGTDAPQYLIRKVNDGSVLDNIAEADLTLAECSDVINAVWPSFVYTGDNGAASQWVMNNIIKNMYQCNMQSEWGHNEDSSVYTYKMGMMTWTKDRT
jgi:hypothetical protein